MSDTPDIPIENIYYLFLYAWNRFEEGQALSTGGDESPDLPNLLSKVLLSGTRRLIRRGLDRGYQPHTDALATIRGRIDLPGTVALKVRHVPRVSCSFDELTHDVLPNQILKATMLRLARVSSIDPGIAHDLRTLSRSLGDVSDIRLSPSVFARVRLHRNNGYYDLLLKICRLAFELMLPESGGSTFAFQEVLRDERRMAAVFENFVRNFYRAEQSTFEVNALQLEWAAIPIGQPLFRLPSMRTDIYLESAGRRIIIDTKYYAEALQQYQGSPSFRSENLYQLFAYLRNDDAAGTEQIPAEGMLLYPANHRRLNDAFEIHGHTVRISTIDLGAPWQHVDSALRSLILETAV